jgi:hydroxymethylpyrimidine pyrophosphatase-like HAD family hydrolase
MLTRDSCAPTLVGTEATQSPELFASELTFYGRYDWCLDPHQPVRQVLVHLDREIGALRDTSEFWQFQEKVANIYLLACALLNTLEESVRGPALRLPRQLASRRVGRRAARAAEFILSSFRGTQYGDAIRWTERLQQGLRIFLAASLCGGADRQDEIVQSATRLAATIAQPLTSGLGSRTIGVPSLFRRLDLTPDDILALGRHFIAQCPDRSQPLLLLGLRSSGSYVAPLLQAFLDREGFATVAAMTIQPDKGPDRRERMQLERYAQHRFMALILDDSPHTGGTVVRALEAARHAGFPRGRLRALLPVHPANISALGPLNDAFVIALPPEMWHKRRLLSRQAVEARLAEYYGAEGFSSVRVVPSRSTDEINAWLAQRSVGNRGSRLKRVHTVMLGTGQGEAERRDVLVKSVGWGWLGYQAFLAAHRLSGRVPRLLGLRDGLLYAEWLPHAAAPGRDELIEAAASYVAERVGTLGLESVPAGRKRLRSHENGLKLIAKALSKAHGRFITDLLARPALEQALARLLCPVPTWIDGRMERTEWITGPQRIQKTDFEHHGMGKAEVNTVDPAFDIADAILSLRLRPEEEAALLRHYTERSGDTDVALRLFVNKLLAGLWAMQSAQEYLFGKAQPSAIQAEHHERWLHAWDFLTVHAARFCGQYCAPLSAPGFHAPLVVLDVDGVIDRRIFGFPCTTAAGIAALSALHRQGCTVVLNTARSAEEVREYCLAYSLAGGIAEHGTWIWNAHSGEARALIDDEALRQLDVLREWLRSLPGVFLDHRHAYSIRAFTYQPKSESLSGSVLQSFGAGIAASSPLPPLLIQQGISELDLDRLVFHNTTIDTTVHAKAYDKGTGLAAFRNWVLSPEAETIAVGDSAGDLPMFREATRCFAPAHIDCAQRARLLGCQVVGQPYQRGLLEIVHAQRSLCQDRDGRPATKLAAANGWEDVFLQALRAADEPPLRHLVRAIFRPESWRVFLR